MQKNSTQTIVINQRLPDEREELECSIQVTFKAEIESNLAFRSEFEENKYLHN